MNKMMSMVKRNCMVFLKDGSSVFFSLLSMVIVLVLTGVFLGQMNVNSIVNLLAEYGGERDAVVDEANARQMVQYWTLAGLMVVNSLTVTLTVIGTMVTDKADHKLRSFYTTPVSKLVVSISYIVSAVLIGFFFCMITLAGYLVYIFMTGGELISIGAVLQVLGLTFVNVIIFSIFMYLVALFVKSSSAWGGIGTVVGTLVGFLGAIYVPLGALPASVAKVLKCLPILHSTALMRKAMCEESMVTTFTNMPSEVLAVYRDEMGIDLVVKSHILDEKFHLLFLVICGMIALSAIAIVGKKKEQ